MGGNESLGTFVPSLGRQLVSKLRQLKKAFQRDIEAKHGVKLTGKQVQRLRKLLARQRKYGRL